MRTGWLYKYKLNRPLTPRERQNPLPKDKPVEQGRNFHQNGLIQINSTYIDWIDSRFRLRGMTAGAAALVGFAFGCLFYLALSIIAIIENDITLLLASIVILPVTSLFYFFVLRFEFFTYTHYPIRFNRKNRQVYVFKHNGPNGVLTVPWDEVHFHIGWDKDQPYLRNIRGEIMEGDIIRQTFSVGNDFDVDKKIHETWEFIRRYMDQGPEAVSGNPVGARVQLSVVPKWRNDVTMAGLFCGVSNQAQYVMRAPVYYWFAATRWLIFKTCKEPVFPADVEAECRVEPDDPNVWPLPELSFQW